MVMCFMIVCFVIVNWHYLEDLQQHHVRMIALTNKQLLALLKSEKSAQSDAGPVIEHVTEPRPFTNCTNSTCSFDACDTHELQKENGVYDKLGNLYKYYAPQSASPYDGAAAHRGFNNCVNIYDNCSEADVHNSNSVCSKYPTCTANQGQYCAWLPHLQGARAIYCAARHLVSTTGHVFDFFASFGGFAVQTVAGLRQNGHLFKANSSYLYASVEADIAGIKESVYPSFYANMAGFNYVLLRNGNCVADFNMTKYITTMDDTLEMITLDIQPEKGTIQTVDEVFPRIESNETSIRVIVVQNHEGDNYGLRLMKTLNDLVEAKRWDRIYSANPYYEWSPLRAQRSKTLMEVYLRLV